MTSSSPRAAWQPAFGPESDRTQPLYLRIAEAIEVDVQTGRLPPGTRLPTQRELASRLRTTVGTITRAYSFAARRGIVSAEVGRGTFVRVHHAGRLSFEERESDAARFDLKWSPPLPVDEVEAPALRAALRSLANEASLLEIVRNDEVRASLRQRSIAARWLAQSGLPNDAERIVVTAGVQHAMNVVTRALLAPGDVVLCEALTYPGMRALARDARLELAPVSMDEHGLVPSALDAACRHHRPRALYCVPTVHPITTATLPLDRRRAIAAIAREHDLLVIEDDDDTPLCSPTLPPLAALAPERVLYLADINKALAPGLRIAFISAPHEYVTRLSDAVRSTIFLTSPLATELVCRLLEAGVSQRVSRARRDEARHRQARAKAILPRIAGTNPLRGSQSAHHLWYPLPPTLRSDVLAERCAARGVSVAPGSLFAIGGRGPQALRISLSGESDRRRLESGLRLLAKVLVDAIE